MIDTQQMLASGCIEGPFRKTRPVTVSFWNRLARSIVGRYRVLQMRYRLWRACAGKLPF